MKEVFIALLIVLILLPSGLLAQEEPDTGTVTIKKSYVFEAIIKMMEMGDKQLIELMNKYMTTAPFRDRKIENWEQLNTILKSKNIDPQDVDWVAVNKYCQPLEKSQESFIYNQCRFDRAMMQQSHYGDLTYCKAKTEREYPDELLKKTIDLQKITSLNENNEVEMKTISIGPFSEVELDRKRSSSYEECMEKRGWNNPYDWQIGKVSRR